MVTEPSAGDLAGTPRAGQEAYLGLSQVALRGSMSRSTLWDGHRTQGSQSGEHDEGQHLTLKETVLGEIAQDRKRQALGRAEAGPDPRNSGPK